MTSRDPKHAFTSRPRDVETWVRASDVTARRLIISPRDLRSTSPPPCVAASRLQHSGAESLPPKCCAICCPASFLPIPGAPHDRTHACRAPVDQEAGREPDPLRSDRQSTYHRPPVARRIV